MDATTPPPAAGADPSVPARAAGTGGAPSAHRGPDPIAGILEALLPDLAAWLPQRRWYVREGEDVPRLEIRAWSLLVPDAERDALADPLALMVVLRSRAEGSGGARDYQVPILLRDRDAAETAGDEADAVIGEVPWEGRTVRAVDATCEDAGRRALLALLTRPGPAGAGGLLLRPEAVREDRIGGAVQSSRLLGGEQSNTSMIFDVEGSAALILKLFRVLQDGANPDVEVQGALDAAGSARIAPMVGAVRADLAPGADPAAGREDAPAGAVPGPAAGTAHSLFAQQFLPGVQDAWRVALEQARRGEDFSAAARELGEATAEVHRDLARELPTAPADDAARAAVLQAMRERLRTVAAAVAQVARYEAELQRIIDRAGSGDWPLLQRIHGDYHLGQVLAVPDRGWILLDFEGEPLRSLEERCAVDSPLRDVAGMLRSVDYVSATVRREHDADASAWSGRAREAFWDGYCARAGWDAEAVHDQLTAFEADKAVYEALYELRHRPGWIDIPLAAIARIAADAR
ncbi:aminoglycoside phosphotransferase [Brachybacterium phenoliresistens]|uniref:Maltokinase n=1 Tax=Brachybacterium phenoliresistens TaxID=396014 RepID=Z9JQB8_9MICO|nr:trehalose biosynthesis protein [Brachybacterium phenoliresistens]EWS80223.1 aminoglycoside phosphotransferase [Brachybacterium phenoliresistens]